MGAEIGADRRRELGRRGEQAAAQFLTARGLAVIDRNWRSRTGELDLVAVDGDAHVFVEVKTRTGTGFGAPAEAVTARKARRIRGLAIEWLRAHGVFAPEIRFDVIAVYWPSGHDPRIEHLAGVF